MRWLLIFLFVTAMDATAQPPMPFPEGNANWTVLSWAQGGPPGFSTSFWHYGSYGILGDTMISGESYSKIAFVAGQLFEPDQSIYHAAMRDVEGKWWCVPADQETEYLLYDFSAGAGDTVVINNPFWPDYIPLELVVTSIDLDPLIGRRIWAMASDGLDFVHWIEGIGSANGLLEFEDTGFWDGGYLLACFSQNDSLIYQGLSNYDCMSPLGMETMMAEASPTIVLMPNPADISTMIRSSYPIEMVTIWDARGRMVTEQRNGPVLSTSSLPAGIYLVRIIDKQDRHHSVKLVVER